MNIKQFGRKILKRDIDKKTKHFGKVQKLFKEDPVIQLDEFNGCFEIGKESTILRRILTYGHYEPEIVSQCQKYINPNLDAIDIGANVGFYSVLFAKVINADRKVLAIEPTREVFQRLCHNLNKNNVFDKVETFKGVVSNSSTSIQLNSIVGNEEYSSIGVMEHPSIKGKEFITYEVDSQTLDNLVTSFQLQPGFIKIDVEGAEKMVLDGAFETIKTYKPVILAEVSNILLERNGSSSLEVLSFLEDFGYKIINAKSPGEPIAKKAICDILCIPPKNNDH